MREDETENLTLEKIELAGDMVEEPLLSKTVRELVVGLKHRKVVVGPFFCECGKSLNKQNVTRCSHCKKLMCKDCGISYSYLNEIHCKQCLHKEHQISLTKPEYMILLCVSSDFTSCRTIFRLAGIQPDVVKSKIRLFMDKYVTKRIASISEIFFRKLRLTNLGNDALNVFDKIYGKDSDSMLVKQRILELKSERERTERSYRLRAETFSCTHRDC